MTKVVVAKGVEREILSTGENLMIVKFEFTKGAEHPWHAHKHEQGSYIAKGKVRILIEDNEIIISQGMSGIILPNFKHKIIALEDSVVINTFTPIRDDY